jgi:polyhydroxyalkanoate synthesis regulator phasin
MIDDIRKTLEGLMGTLTPAKAQQLAKDLMEPGAAKEQVAKVTADLLEWSQANRERMRTFVRREISEQMKAVGGIATQAELDALKKRVRDLERAAGMTASGRAKTTRGSTSSRKRTTSKRRTTSKSTSTSAAKPAVGSTAKSSARSPATPDVKPAATTRPAGGSDITSGA